MFKIIILSQIGADRYKKHIFEIPLLSPLGELCNVHAICSYKKWSYKKYYTSEILAFFKKSPVELSKW